MDESKQDIELTADTHDPMGLTHRLDREYRELLEKGVDPREAACKIKLRRKDALHNT